MILISAVLIGFSTAGILWICLSRVVVKSSLDNRLADLPTHVSFPYPVDGRSRSKREDDTTLEESYADKVVRQLYLAGMRRKDDPKKFRVLMKAAFILPLVMILMYGLTGSLNTSTLLTSLSVGLVLFVFTRFQLVRLKRQRHSRISASLPQFFDLLVVCLEAGLTFMAALPRVIEESDPRDPLVAEFSSMHHEYIGGLSLAEACDRMSRRCEVADLSVILSSIVESEHFGSALVPVMRIQAAELRDKHRQRMREKAHKIPVKLLFPMLLIFITLFVVTLFPAFFKLKNVLGEFEPQAEKTEEQQTAGRAKRIQAAKNNAAEGDER